MKYLKVTLFIILLLPLASLHAAVYDFLDVGLSARPNAMGGSFSAISNDICALQWNPAGLVGIEKGMLSTGVLLYTKAGIKFGDVKYGFGKGKNTFGFGLNYVNYGSIERRGESNEDLGTFTPMDIFFISGFSRSITEDLTAGIGVKLVYEKIDSFVSYGAGADIGIQYIMQERNITLGFVLKNLGTVFKAHDEEKGSFPLSATGGFSFHPIQQVNVNVDFTRYFSDPRSIVKFGAELWPVQIFAIRLGYSSAGSDLKTDFGPDFLAGTAGGFGVSWEKFYLDYA
ncbi:PorV/PorQ family protein, partial [candidate division WOR-3 bacterium]|nr:PorV/PorQ family protein [candidate division WOR-3 bacterium]